MARAPRPDLRQRFERIVAGAIAKADREHREHLARLRPRRRLSRAERNAAHGRIVFRPRSAELAEL